MDTFCINRLLVVGSVKDLRRFYRDEAWMAASGGRHFELLEHSPTRHAWQFDTDAPPLAFAVSQGNGQTSSSWSTMIARITVSKD